MCADNSHSLRTIGNFDRKDCHCSDVIETASRLWKLNVGNLFTIDLITHKNMKFCWKAKVFKRRIWNLVIRNWSAAASRCTTVPPGYIIYLIIIKLIFSLYSFCFLIALNWNFSQKTIWCIAFWDVLVPFCFLYVKLL